MEEVKDNSSTNGSNGVRIEKIKGLFYSDIRKVKVAKEDGMSRVRKDFGDLFKLAESIKRHGLIHPIVVEETQDGYKLIAGERRLRASIIAGLAMVPVVLRENADDIVLKEIELEENVVRKDLSWPEQCEALRQLDELKRKKFGSAVRGKMKEGSEWGIEDTAELVGRSVGIVHRDIALAKALKDDPSLMKKVARLPKHAAEKMVKRIEEKATLQRQVDNKQLKLSSDLLFGNCLQLIDSIPDASVHMILTDPPFASQGIQNVSNTKNASSKSFTYNLVESNVSNIETMMMTHKVLMPKLYKKLVPGGHIYMFFGIDTYHEIITMLRNAGFIIDGVPLIWWKMRVSIQAHDIHYMSSYEPVFFGYKPPMNRILLKPCQNVLAVPALPPQSRVHPLQRPFDLLKIFIENSSNVGEKILDPFAGSGSTIVAARRLGRSGIGFELDEGNFLKAQQWLKEEEENL